MEFGRKHLPDKFFLDEEKGQRVSLRYILCREMIGNTLIHREFTSSYWAKFVIEKDCMYVENANRTSSEEQVASNRLTPNPKNPIIAAFFRNIGYADQAGSGVRNLFKYSTFYSGQDPEFVKGDVFRIIVPLDETYSYDFGQNGQDSQSNQLDQSNRTCPLDGMALSKEEQMLLDVIRKSPDMTNTLLAEELSWTVSRVKYYIQKLKKANRIKRIGNSRTGFWEVL